MSEPGTSRSQGLGLGRGLGQHESDVLLQVPPPRTLSQGAEQAERDEKGRDREKSVHHCQWP